jgi:signal transduction histidine kinase
MRRNEPVELARLLDSIAEFFRPLAEEKNVELNHPKPPVVTVLGDAGWLRTLFGNLVENAIKYSRPGDSVDLSASMESGCVTVAVSDTGVGIDPEDRERFFERFYRGGARESPGVGLGLPLALEIARAHRGTIEVDTQQVAGCMFKVRLPVDSLA